MLQRTETAGAAEARQAPSTGLTLILAGATGAIVANIYYVQPLIGIIAPSLHMAKVTASLLVTLTQLGYALGLIFLVPLGDLVENRALILRTVAATILALALAAIAPDAAVFLAAPC